MTSSTTRRRFIGSVALTGSGLTLASQGNEHAAGAAVRQEASPASAGIYGTTRGPAWTFTIHDYQDPYSGEVTRPEEPPPGTRYVGADVQIDNEIDNQTNQVLIFDRDDVRLRDQAGYEYRAGFTFGDAPAFDGRTLNPGERARGWVWFTVSTESEITEMIFLPSSPQFLIPIVER